MTMRIEIKDEITLFNGTFQGEPIYYMVAYNNCSPRVIILNKNKSKNKKIIKLKHIKIIDADSFICFFWN